LPKAAKNETGLDHHWAASSKPAPGRITPMTITCAGNDGAGATRHAPGSLTTSGGSTCISGCRWSVTRLGLLGLDNPIVNIWFPFQITGDIWRAGLPAPKRRKTAWLPALWWTCWLLSGLSFSGQAMSSNLFGVPHIAANSQAVSLVFLAIAGAVLIAIIRTASDGPVGSPLS
jgi:Domain of unknown function (DUF4328)